MSRIPADPFIQLLPTGVQQKVLINALKVYSDKMERDGEEEEMNLADELRLEILKKRREAKPR